MKKKIAVGLSGGVDSSVSAYLLKQRGHEVIGFTLKFYPQENRCCDLDSLYQAQRLCHKLDIPHYVIDAGDLFKKEIIDYFIESYLRGRTPNPCAYCNRVVKFGLFLEKVKSFGIDYLATGHYARLTKKKGTYFIKANKDKKKTQEYFLSLIKPQVLKSLVFPLSNYTKDEVKKIAKSKKIIFKERKESQDVCFIRNKDYPHFIEENTKDYFNYAGDIRHISGKALGRHKGIYRYTYGQREGLGISWREPLYVTSIDAETNTVVVGERDSLCRDTFGVHSLNWFLPPTGKMEVKVRYNCKSAKCDIKITKDKALVKLSEKISAITPGQVAAFYHKDILVGGGIISKNPFC